ncbi:hypothetical protein P0136_10800 [Lentisphaerota bacterium ZTH]|nr:hypothetical protein JYG24_11680 [Lentisphaerota bacterium]WET05850.1 hypothetical protein P0136_10800 [Lentisphaerota bacterium ZTH]
MRILLIAVFLGIGAMMLQGCLAAADSGDVSEYNQLSEKEKADLVNFARYFLTKNDKFATQEQKAYILKTPPEMKVHYIAPKTGKAVMDWNLEDKVIRVICRGEFCTDRMQWKVAIYKKGRVKINSDAGDVITGKKLTKQDFSDLLEKK